MENETVADPLDGANVSRLPAAPDGNGVVPVRVVVVDPGSVKVFVPPPVAVMRVKVFAPVITTAPVPPVVTFNTPYDFPFPAKSFVDVEVLVSDSVPVVAVTVRFADVALNTFTAPVRDTVPVPKVRTRVAPDAVLRPTEVALKPLKSSSP